MNSIGHLLILCLIYKMNKDSLLEFVSMQHNDTPVARLREYFFCILLKYIRNKEKLHINTKNLRVKKKRKSFRVLSQ